MGDPGSPEWERAGYDSPDRPAAVSRSAWNAIFPPDRNEVRKLAARMVRHGTAPDYAVFAASATISRQTILSGETLFSCAVRALTGGLEDPEAVDMAIRKIVRASGAARRQWQDVSSGGQAYEALLNWTAKGFKAAGPEQLGAVGAFLRDCASREGEAIAAMSERTLIEADVDPDDPATWEPPATDQSDPDQNP